MLLNSRNFNQYPKKIDMERHGIEVSFGDFVCHAGKEGMTNEQDERT